MPDTPPEHKYPEKLSDRMEIRLHSSVKQRFLSACKRTGEIPSDVLRAAMKVYIEEVEAAERPTLTKELSMKLIHNPLKTLAALGTSVAAAVMFTATPSTAEDRDASPIGAPLVTYPAELAEQGVTGECKAFFDVSAAGLPENVKAECTHPGFVEVTIASAKTLKFDPKTEDGKPVRRKGVVYPIRFEISDNTDIGTLEDEFAKLDTNDDGFLTSDENIAQGWIDAMDTDGDGRADFAEYKAYLWSNVE